MLKKINLGTKFTLLMSAVLLGGIVLSYFAFAQVLQARAQDEVADKSLVLIALMNAVRDYTSTHVNPLLQDKLASEPKFVSESVPSFSARETFENLRKRAEYGTFLYKEATPNPMNPRNKADEFEKGLIEKFRSTPGLTEISGYRDVGGARLFYNARPMQVKTENCLSCHTTPATAPASLIATYGSQGGFGWKLNDVIAAQIIYVPAENVIDIAQTSLVLVMGIFVIIFAIAILSINFLLRRNVIHPIGQIAGLAQALTTGLTGPAQEEIKQLDNLATRNDELGQLGRLFQKMAREVQEREERLKQQVRELSIQIDQTKKAQQVAEITESDYFQKLQARAKEIRSKSE